MGKKSQKKPKVIKYKQKIYEKKIRVPKPEPEPDVPNEFENKQLCIQERQLQILYNICHEFCKDLSGCNGIDKIRNCYAQICEKSGGDKDYIKEQCMLYLPDKFQYEYREQTGQL